MSMTNEEYDFMSNLIKLRFLITELDFMYRKYGLCTICADGRIKVFETEKPTATTAGKVKHKHLNIL